jgi:hypothetical protein
VTLATAFSEKSKLRQKHRPVNGTSFTILFIAVGNR